jgi:hypothetical protein
MSWAASINDGCSQPRWRIPTKSGIEERRSGSIDLSVWQNICKGKVDEKSRAVNTGIKGSEEHRKIPCTGALLQVKSRFPISFVFGTQK